MTQDICAELRALAVRLDRMETKFDSRLSSVESKLESLSPSEEAYTLEEISERLKVSLSTVKREVAAKRLRVFLVASLPRVSKTDFVRYTATSAPSTSAPTIAPGSRRSSGAGRSEAQKIRESNRRLKSKR